MNAHSIIIRSDLENIISTPSDQYENNLQQELEELIFVGSEDESENEAPSMPQEEDDNDQDIIVMNEETAVYSDRNYVCLDDIKSQSSSSGKITLYLTEEEQGIINNCTDPKLKQLLLINRTKAVHIKELCKKLYRLYDELDKNIRKEKEKFRQEENVKENPEVQSMAKTYIWRIGMPFFKDKSFYSAPPNKDLAIKKENKEFFATKVNEGRKWTDGDQQILRDSVIANYFKQRKVRLEQDIRVLKVHLKNATEETERTELRVEMENLEKILEEVKAMKNEPPPLNCDEGIDWLKIANFDLKARHTYLECRAFWNIYLHPSINKTDWLPEENEKIKELAITYDYDWDVISKELNTNRSPYLVCVHYNTKLCDKFKRQRFLPEEDEFLLEVVENCRLGDYIPWGRVAYYFEDRSKHQLYHRYKYYLSCKNIKKGTFTEAEDILLTYLTERFGKDFSRISELMPQRTSIQLRNRYTNYLEKLNIQLGNFTHADDRKILNHVEVNGHKSWSILASELKRTRAHVRQRYLTLMRCWEKNPNSTIDSLPRRKQLFLSSCQVKKNSRLATCLEKLKELQGIPTLATVETFVKQIDREIVKKEKQWRVLRAPVRNPKSDVDKKIINFFKGSCKFQRETKVLDERVVVDSARRIIKLFEVLGADANCLKEGEVADDFFMLDNDEEILKSIKKVLHENNNKLDSKRGNNSFMLDKIQSNAATIPSPSHFNPLSVDLPKHQIKHLLPPTVNTLLGLRGMIIKYQVYKAANKNLTSTVKLVSTKIDHEDPMVWKIQQNLLECDVLTKTKIEHERDLFCRRFWAILKWPCIISKNFPEHLTKIEEENQEKEEEEEEDIIEEQQEKRKVGRPPKKVYAKVLKMVEARKRKIVDISSADESKKTNDVSKATTSYCGETTTVSGETARSNSDASETEPKKRRRGRPPNKSKSEHAVAYIPRRSHVKINKPNEKPIGKEEEIDFDDPDNISEPTTNENKTFIDDSPSDISIETTKSLKSSTAHKVINVSDIKLLNSNAILVGKDKINNLMKLKNAKKIIVLQGTNQKFIANDKNIVITPTKKETPEDISHIQHFTITESRQEPTRNRAIHQQPSTSTFHQNGGSDEILTMNQNERNTESRQNEASDAQQFMVTESQQKLLGEAIHQNPSTPTPGGSDEIHTEVIINLPKPHHNEQMICINKQKWNKYLQKWKNLKLPEAEKEVLEQDLNKIEKEATITGSETNTVEPNGLDRNLHTTFEIKIENNIEEESEEMDSISRELSQELPFEEYKRFIDGDGDSCNKELKAEIENNMKFKNTRKLSATIQRMREKMKESSSNFK